jgi:TatD DNase family protein
MGLDYHQETEAAGRNRQRECFAYQLSLAGKSQLPVVIHTRAAEADTLSHLRSQAGVIGVLHCFTESWDMASAALDLGYYISISGIVTFRNGDNVREVARKVPADRLLVETDAPWLAPVPHRGRKNVPAYVRDTAEYLAALRGTTLEELAQTTTANFFALFKKAQNSSSNSR